MPLLRELKSLKQSFSVTRIHFLPHVLFIFLQSGNHVHALTLHCGSAAADDLKTVTNKLEISDLNESVTQPVCVLS